MPGDRFGKARFSNPQYDRHRWIARAGAERDLEVQGVDVGQRDKAMCGAEIAEIERRISARISGQQVEVLFACPLDDRRIGRALEQQVDDTGPDAAGSANDDVSAAVHRTETLHRDPLHPRQQRGAECDEETGQRDAGEHQQHRGGDVGGVAPVRRQIAISGRRHGRDHEVDGVEPSPSDSGMEIPSSEHEHGQGCHGEPGENRVESRRMVPVPAQQRP